MRADRYARGMDGRPTSGEDGTGPAATSPARGPGRPVPAADAAPATAGGPRPSGRTAPADGPPPPRGWFARFLATVEWLGNLLPHPVTLFALCALAVLLLSGLCAALGVSAEDPRPAGTAGRSADGIIRAQSLLTGDGLRWITTSLVTNFTGFVPLGTVLVALLGVGVAEKSGLLSAAVRSVVLAAPRRLVVPALVFAGVVSNTASEMGYVVIVPLGAVIFHALGRHPLAGLAAAFAGVSGGYSANILIGTVDPLLAGITQQAARFVDPVYEVHPAVNWYFMAASTFVVTILGSLVTTRIVEPRLGRFNPDDAAADVPRRPSVERLTAAERRGLARAGVAALAMSLFIALLAGPRFSVEVEVPALPERNELAVALGWSPRERDQAIAAAEALPEAARIGLSMPVRDGVQGSVNAILQAIPLHGVLREPRTGTLVPSPLLRSVVALILVFFIVPGFVYGRATGTMRTDRDIIDAMAEAMSKMGLYIVLVFFAAQFVAFFDRTNLGAILAVHGADVLEGMGLRSPLVFLPFILMCCFVNLMLGSASAQWAITAPIFVPMLMRLGYSPEVIQAAYRIGDSTTNIVTPMMSYFGLILAFAARYDRRLGIGTLISTMLPFCLVFIVGWIAFFYLWVFMLDLPVGPGAPTTFAPAAAPAAP